MEGSHQTVLERAIPWKNQALLNICSLHISDNLRQLYIPLMLFSIASGGEPSSSGPLLPQQLTGIPQAFQPADCSVINQVHLSCIYIGTE